MLNKNINALLLASFALSASMGLNSFTIAANPSQSPTTKPTPGASVKPPTPGATTPPSTAKPSPTPAAKPKPAPTAKPSPTPAAKPKPAPKPVTSSKLEPISETACKGVKGYLIDALNKKGTEVKLQNNVAFEDMVSKVKGTACQLTTTTTAKNFKSIADVAKPLHEVLTKQEWQEDTKHAADGAEGKLMRFRKVNNIIVVDIKSSLAKEVKCTENVPVDSCYQKAKPEQINYTIVLTAARSVK